MSKVLLSSVIVLIFFTGCANDAPSLPADYYSIDTTEQLVKSDFTAEQLALSCQNISKQISDLAILNKEYQSKTKNVIHGTHVMRQTTYGTAYAFPLLIPIDTNSQLNSQIRQSYDKADILYKLQVFKNCNE